jgi:Flp pilus assembly protein TadG
MKSQIIIDHGKKSKGQVLVLVALIFLALVAFIGLAIDTGMVFITYTNLRRAVDSAALAGASKYRLNVAEADMAKIATEYLRLNGVEDATAVVTTCDSEPGLCPTDQNRKLVHVVASAPVSMNFISVLGFNTITVSAQATSEAASLDVILVLDTSESMTYDAPYGNTDGGLDMRDPMVCNNEDLGGSDGYPGDCFPFQDVKKAAVDFVNQLYFPYDRVGVVTFDRWDNYPTRLDLTNNKGQIINYIKNLQVTPWMQVCPTDPASYTLPTDKFVAGPCAGRYPDPTDPASYYIYDCMGLVKSAMDGASPADPRTCGATNIGAGMESANEMFFTGRDSALWVVILLTDGAANASVSRFSGSDITDPTAPDYYGYCPNSTWTIPYCRDGRSDPWGSRPASGTASYDSADFAYDMIDLVADRDTTLDAAQKLIFTIGLGDAVTQNSACWNGTVEINDCDPDAGELLLKYAAEQGDGSYYFAPSTAQLKRVFQDIAEKIAFRITH